jgi:8-oxo-dGTP pyrophosphatase MutT (NUDIX family)
MSLDKPVEHQQYNIGVKALITSGKSLLLLKRVDYDKWDMPGGRINKGELPHDALLRELIEELPGITNIKIGAVIHAEPQDFTLPNGKQLMLLFYPVTATLPILLKSSAEHNEIRWINKASIVNLPLQKPIKTATELAFRLS